MYLFQRIQVLTVYQKIINSNQHIIIPAVSMERKLPKAQERIQTWHVAPERNKRMPSTIGKLHVTDTI